MSLSKVPLCAHETVATCRRSLRRATPARLIGLTIQELWPTFAADQVRGATWKRKIADQSFGTMRAWVKAIGDTLPELITPAPAMEFQRIMRRLPGNYAKCSAWRAPVFRGTYRARRGHPL